MRQTILTVLLVFLLLAAGFVWFRYVRDAVPAVSSEPAEADERLQQYRHLKNLKADLSIFSDPLFRSLQQTLPPPSNERPPTLSGGSRPGRTNPFNPL